MSNLAASAVFEDLLEFVEIGSQNGLVMDDVDIVVDVGDLDRSLKEVHQVGSSSSVIKLAHIDELIDNGFRIDWLVVRIKFLHRPEDEDVAWIFARKVLFF